MVVAVRTGRPAHSSTARFARVSAAILPENHAPPEVAHQLAELLPRRHRLIQVGQEIAE
jgi:hypothetical protein